MKNVLMLNEYMELYGQEELLLLTDSLFWRYNNKKQGVENMFYDGKQLKI